MLDGSFQDQNEIFADIPAFELDITDYVLDRADPANGDTSRSAGVDPNLDLKSQKITNIISHFLSWQINNPSQVLCRDAKDEQYYFYFGEPLDTNNKSIKLLEDEYTWDSALKLRLSGFPSVAKVCMTSASGTPVVLPYHLNVNYYLYVNNGGNPHFQAHLFKHGIKNQGVLCEGNYDFQVGLGNQLSNLLKVGNQEIIVNLR